MKSDSNTKAEILNYLKPRLKQSVIDPFLSFSFREWKTEPKQVLDAIQAYFPSRVALIVRSSTTDEDNRDRTLAGFYHSQPGVYSDDETSLVRGIDTVLLSYAKGGRVSKAEDQFIVQSQVQNVVLSGVVLTRDHRLRLPYYLINYDELTKKTNTVTAGGMSQALKIFAWQDMAGLPIPWQNLMVSVQEIEHLFQNKVLNIEFCVDAENVIHIFQVRFSNLASFRDPAAISRKESLEQLEGLRASVSNALISPKSDNLSGSFTILADMTDWNPAEIIGNRPDIFDYSLYRFLVTENAWNQARASIGYTDVTPHELMLLIGDKPYIDTRVSFNSLTPSAIPIGLREPLIDFYLERLKSSPSLQDKVEFEIAFTCYDFSFNKKAVPLRAHGFLDSDIDLLRQSLTAFTSQLLQDTHSIIESDLKSIERLEARRELLSLSDGDALTLIDHAARLFKACRNLGTIPFARLARLAFIGLSILKSLQDQGLITDAFYETFLGSISTVATQLSEDWHRLATNSLDLESFLERYGHLRPGTYSILVRRYDDSPNLFTNLVAPGVQQQPMTTILCGGQTIAQISSALKSHQLDLSARTLLNLIQESVEAREYSKFQFSKSLSDGIELVAAAGNQLGFSRNDLAFLDISTLARCHSAQFDRVETKDAWDEVIEANRRRKESARGFALPPVIVSDNNLLNVPYYESSPNFVTRKRVEGFSHYLEAVDAGNVRLAGMIVLLESADPGYDWVFAQGLRALITQYGGAASHMAIRCAEFGLPAAIGCGEVAFTRLRNAQKILLDCRTETIVIVY